MTYKILHYINQFFAGIGGEDKADFEPKLVAGAVGPGAQLDKLLDGKARICATYVCGDNYFAEHTDAVLADFKKALDEYRPDIIIAGFGRVGQIVGRLLTANGHHSTVLDYDIDQIELLRRFDRPVHYGDASRLDLLRAAGAERAKLLIIAIDDRDKAVEMVETVRQAFPDLPIVARAFDRRHAYELLASGAHAVERETFQAALAMGAKGLEIMGMPAARARKAAALFRRHDEAQFETLRPNWGDEDAYILAARDAGKTMDALLKADIAALDAEDGPSHERWGAASFDEAMKAAGPKR